MKDFDLGWLVGLIEGEGNFGSTYNVHASGRRNGPYIRFQIAMSDLDTIMRFRKLAGIKAKPRALKKRAPHHAQLYQLSMLGKSARELAWLVEPHLSVRRRAQIKAALDAEMTARC